MNFAQATSLLLFHISVLAEYSKKSYFVCKKGEESKYFVTFVFN